MRKSIHYRDPTRLKAGHMWAWAQEKMADNAPASACNPGTATMAPTKKMKNTQGSTGLQIKEVFSLGHRTSNCCRTAIGPRPPGWMFGAVVPLRNPQVEKGWTAKRPM